MTTRNSEADERESVRLLRTLIDTFNTLRDSYIRREVNTEKMGEYLAAMDETLQQFAKAMQSADADRQTEFNELRVTVELTRQELRERMTHLAGRVETDGKEWRSTVLMVLNRLLILVGGILASIGLWKGSLALFG